MKEKMTFTELSADLMKHLQSCKSIDDLYVLRGAISAMIEKYNNDKDTVDEWAECCFYKQRVIAQIEYLESKGIFLNDIGKEQAQK